MTLATLAWTLGQLERAFNASEKLTGPSAGLAADLASDVTSIIQQALPVLGTLEAERDTVPTRDDIRAVRGAGWPWKPVAEVAEVFLALQRGGAAALASRLLRPDGFPESIFQLSVLGAVLTACERAGGTVTSLRPIGHMTDGPVYRVDWPQSPSWDVWCEAASAWSQYQIDDTYRGLAAHMTYASSGPFASRNIRPDILIAIPGEAAVVLECKFPVDSLDPGYVGHGLYQAAFYAQQLKPAFQRVLGAVVGPIELVPGPAVSEFDGIRLGLVNGLDMAYVVAWLASVAAPGRAADPAPRRDRGPSSSDRLDR